MATDAKTGQPIFGYHSVGVHHVGSYQVSGFPYMTGGFVGTAGGSSEVRVPFPMITKSVTVIASGSMTGDLRVHFVSTGSSTNVHDYHHYISLDN